MPRNRRSNKARKHAAVAGAVAVVDEHATIERRVVCPFCAKTRTLRISAAGFARWKAGALLQNALPELSEDDREAVKSGICGICWDLYFSEEGGGD